MYKKLALYALDVARSLGASYADARYVETKTETVETGYQYLLGAGIDRSSGLGVRVIVNGAWGFASAAALTRDGVEKAVRMAVAIAKASAKARIRPVELVSEKAYTDSWSSPVKIDPFTVPVETKVALLLEAEKIMNKVRGVKVTGASLTFIRERKLFVSTEGSVIEQTFFRSGCGIEAHAFDEDGQHQVRSWPNSFGGQYELGGYEVIEKWKLLDNACRVGEEAVMVARAPLCPEMTTNLILGSSQLGLQIHESIGHPLECDRVFGEELNYAGGSFATPRLLGNFRYGSKIVNVVADATAKGGALGSFKYDDEGVKAQRVDLIKDGILVGYLTSRETAARLGLSRSGGMMRAASSEYTPLVRMTNVSLVPGDAGTLEDLIADTKSGILLDQNYSWSIDDQRHNFQFGCEVGWLIKNGKRKGVVRNPNYWGITSEFWNSCDAICDRSEYVTWGIPSCAKGQPCQDGSVGHGAAPARFRNVKVGVAMPGEMVSYGGSRKRGGTAHGKFTRRHYSLHNHRVCTGGKS